MALMTFMLVNLINLTCKSMYLVNKSHNLTYLQKFCNNDGLQ